MLRRLTYGLAALFTVLFSLLTAPAVAGAQEIVNEDTAIAPTAALTLNAFTVLVIVSLLIPLATGLVTKLQASATVKQIVTLVIATVAGVVTTSTQIDGTAVISLATVQYAALAFAIATVSYLGLYKPHDTNAKLAPSAGLG